MSFKQKYKDLIKKIVASQLGKQHEIYLFGSRARQDNRNTSDVDLALEVVDSDGQAEKIDGLAMANIRECFEESTIPYKIDVVDINNIDKALKQSILDSRESI